MVRRCHNDPWLTRSFFVDCSDLLGQEMCDSETPTTAATATGSVQDSDLGGLGGGFKKFLFSPFFGEDSHFDGLKPPSTQIFCDEPVLEKSRCAECIWEYFLMTEIPVFLLKAIHVRWIFTIHAFIKLNLRYVPWITMRSIMESFVALSF